MDDNDKTVLTPTAGVGSSGAARRLTIRFQASDGSERCMHFAGALIIGRESLCDVRLSDDTVSRYHARIYPDAEAWRIQDLNSANGTYLDGQRVQQALLTSRAALQLGSGGPSISLELPQPVSRSTPPPAESVTQIFRHYFEPAAGEKAGEHTMMVRRAFRQATRKQSRRYVIVSGLVGVLLVGALGIAIYQQTRLSQLKTLTAEIFYSMKDLKLQVARVEKELQLYPGEDREELRPMRTQLAEMEARYQTFLQKLGVFDEQKSEDERLILRMARIFGECEVDVPPGFVAEVKKYIRKWQSTNRLEKAVQRAQRNGYAPIVREAMLEHYLPPQFFYLALQESDFRQKTVGPKTRFGIAKGIWQFIPGTAIRYGLKTGPLLEVRRFDPRDERYNFEKATRAAARYLRDIYTTEAQASGLLVLAAYNFGENRVRKLILEMPENPRERNFWALLKNHKIPKQTYDYVFYTFSAAVIGENPQLFGFEFDNPLRDI